MEITKNSYFLFSGGEVHCKVKEGTVRIIMRDYTMNGFMALAETIEVLRRAYGVKQIGLVRFKAFA